MCEGKPLYLFRSWAEGNWVSDCETLGSARISDLLSALGRMDHQQERIFTRWIDRHQGLQAVVFDITSVSSHGQGIDLVEWGCNRAGERLPQVNLGIVFGQLVDLPLRYHVYPGSIADVSTLKNISRLI